MDSGYAAVAISRRSHRGRLTVARRARLWRSDRRDIQSTETSQRQLLLGKVLCLQPEKIFLPLQLSVFLSQPGQFISLVAGELALIRRTKITAVDSSLPSPLGRTAGREAKPWTTALQLRSSFKQSSIACCFCYAMNRRLVLVGLAMVQQPEGHGVTTIDLSAILRELQILSLLAMRLERSATLANPYLAP